MVQRIKNENQILWDVETDVAVVGGGTCGMIASLAAEEKGVEVLLLEKEKRVGGNTSLSQGMIPAAGTHFQKAAGIDDSPFFELVIDIGGMMKEARKVKLMGFIGKLLVHPRHVEPVNQVFTLTKEEIIFANRMIEAYEEAKTKGVGATSIGGRMIDYGRYRRAPNLISIAEKISEREKRKN